MNVLINISSSHVYVVYVYVCMYKCMYVQGFEHAERNNSRPVTPTNEDHIPGKIFRRQCMYVVHAVGYL